MVERRRNPRIPITLHLSICDLYRENESLTGLHNLNSPIRLTDISLSGIAFVSECVLPVGYFFNATLDTPNHEDKVFSLVKIIRSDTIDHNKYIYGCEFTNPPDNLHAFVENVTTASQTASQ